jgi:hypothetical protein
MKNIFTKIHQKPPGLKNAQGMLEFALVLPVLLFMIIGVIEFSRLMFAWVIIENSTRFGIRYATTGNFDPKYCTDVNNNCTSDPSASPPENLTSAQTNAFIDEARIPSIHDETRRIIIGFPLNENPEAPAAPVYTYQDENYFNITVCSEKTGVVFHEPIMGSRI